MASLAAAVVSHDELDHSGGIAELLGSLPVQRLLYAASRPPAARGGPGRRGHADPGRRGKRHRAPARFGSKSSGRRGSLLEGAPAADPNTRSLVLLARWHGFEMLLTGDAEAEAVPIDPGPLDVIKVAHHGSADDGLDRITRPGRAEPGADLGRRGQPVRASGPETLAALRAHDVPVLRTDLSRDSITIEVGEDGAQIDTGR